MLEVFPAQAASTRDASNRGHDGAIEPDRPAGLNRKPIRPGESAFNMSCESTPRMPTPMPIAFGALVGAGPKRSLAPFDLKA